MVELLFFPSMNETEESPCKKNIYDLKEFYPRTSDARPIPLWCGTTNTDQQKGVIFKDYKNYASLRLVMQ